MQWSFAIPPSPQSLDGVMLDLQLFGEAWRTVGESLGGFRGLQGAQVPESGSQAAS